MDIPDDIQLIDKPKGITSFDCVRQLRRELGVKKIGHAGTLDPMATGLMIMGIGTGTKKLHEYLKLDKTYEAHIEFGFSTDTGDLEGAVVEKQDVAPFSQETIDELVSNMVGTHALAVPRYSAIKKNGKPLYKYAREGKEVEVPIKEMTVQSATLLSYKHPVLSLELSVTSGTYIRSLAEEMGRRLGVPAVLVGLRRTRIGKFYVLGARTVVSH